MLNGSSGSLPERVLIMNCRSDEKRKSSPDLEFVGITLSHGRKNAQQHGMRLLAQRTYCCLLKLAKLPNSPADIHARPACTLPSRGPTIPSLALGSRRRLPNSRSSIAAPGVQTTCTFRASELGLSSPACSHLRGLELEKSQDRRSACSPLRPLLPRLQSASLL